MSYWDTPPSLPELKTNALHVWRLFLPHARMSTSYYFNELSEAEKINCLRFKFANLQRRYAVVHAALRWLLKHYCQQKSLFIEILSDKYGKPYLSDNSLSFNLSHSGDYAVFAFSNIPGLLLGIDVEKVNDSIELSIAKQFFAPGEYAQLSSLSSIEQADAFSHIWTQKEAFIKAIGRGMSYPLDCFETQVLGPAKLLSIRDEKYSHFHWYSSSIALADGYKSCVTASIEPAQIQFYTLPLR